MYFLLPVSVILQVAKSTVYNFFAKKQTPKLCDMFLYNTVMYFVASLIVFCINGAKMPSLFTLGLGFVYALTVFGLQLLMVVAMKNGSMSIVSLFVMYGLILPSLAGPLIWHEPFKLLMGIGLVLILISIALLTGRVGKTDKKQIILSLVCFVLSGVAGVWEKVLGESEYAEEKMPFLFVAFLMSFGFSVVGSVIFRKNTNRVSYKSLGGLGALSGAIMGLLLFVNLTLAATCNAMLYYPVTGGGAVILTVLTSVLVFREKLTKAQLIGCITGLVAIVILSF